MRRYGIVLVTAALAAIGAGDGRGWPRRPGRG